MTSLQTSPALRGLAMTSAMAALLALGACASKPKAHTEADGKVVEHEEAMTDRMGQAVLTPLSDLNMVRTDLPEVLMDAVKEGAYHAPEVLTCEYVAAQVVLLNAALGSDLDAPKGGDVGSWLARGGDMAEDTGVGMVRRTVEGVVPFRSWLRKLSGAERHSRRVSQAFVVGGIRRAYLKGIGMQMGCNPPAAPLPKEPTPPKEAPSLLDQVLSKD